MIIILICNHLLFWPLSCGSWVKEVLEETNPYVKEVCVVGPPKESMEQCKSELASRVVFVTQEELREGKLEQWEAFLEGRKELPVYLSIDKDVLCMEDARTNWDQGEMKLVELEERIKQVFQNRNMRSRYLWRNYRIQQKCWKMRN